jgi:zinc transport system substrate-binding protein
MAVFFAVLPLMSCTAPKQERLQVYTSFYVIYDFVSRIADGYADVYRVVPGGAAAHGFEPTPRDMANIENADIFFYSCLKMEQWPQKLAASVSALVVPLSGELSGKSADPHVWLNPSCALGMMRLAADTLIEADPENKAGYEANYKTAAQKISELDASFNEAGLNGKIIVCDHAAYSHMCEHYGITQIPIDINTGPEVSAARIAETIEYIKDNNIQYIFCNEYENLSVINIIVRETGAKMLYLNPCEYLSDEQLQNNEDYFSIMYKNLESLKTGAR